MRRIKLFCFPHAGGSAMAYDDWNKLFSEQIEIKPIELAGRGRRIDEPLYDTPLNAVDDLFTIIENEIFDNEYAFFGHSMGAILAYELALKIKEKGKNLPKHLFLSGKGVPNSKDKKYYLLNDDDIKKKILEFGGTPPEVLDYPAFTEFFIPLMRSDFRIASMFIEDREIRPLDIEISILLGKDEDINADDVYNWRKYTQNLCSIYCFNGGHFFLHQDAKQEVIQIINDKLTRL